MARRERAFAIVLGLAVVVRVLAWIAFYPSLFFPDSWPYLGLGWGSEGFVDLRFDRPSGYPIFLWAIGPLVGHNTAGVAAIQQLLGLGVGVLVYALLVRLGARRWIATTAAALVLFDAYLITLAQHVLSDVVMTALVLGGVALVLRPPAARRPAWAAGAAGLAGLLLGCGVTVRTASLFILPVVLVYALWARREWRVVIPLVVGMALPVAGYLEWHKQDVGSFSFTQADGWFLYARVAEIGTCGGADIPKDARPICPRMFTAPVGAAVNLWGGLQSPARQTFGVGPESEDERVNRTLKGFAVAIVRARPVIYTRMVGRDVVRYFQPGEHALGGSDVAVSGQVQPLRPEPIRAGTIKAWAPAYDGRANLPRWPIEGYARVLHTPRPLLGVLILAAGALLAAAIALPRRLPLPRRREAFLLLGGGLALVVGATATSDFILRYLMPALPLLWAGIALVATDVLDLRAAKGMRSA